VLTSALVPLPKLPGYRVERLAGRGGFGSVYEARRLSDRARVAIKLAHAEDAFALRRLWYEGLALRAVGAPYVPALEHEGTLADGTRFLVMEWIRDPTLADRLRELPSGMRLREFAPLAVEMARAIGQLHRRGFLHMDLKPEHIVLSSQGDELQVRLLDLGLVKPLNKPEPTRARARRGMIVGTSTYMSPEQLRGIRAGVEADIYSIGIIMLEMLTGQRPFNVPSSQVWGAVPEHTLVRVSGAEHVPVGVRRVLERCLAIEAQDRYRAAHTLRGALTRALRRAGAL